MHTQLFQVKLLLTDVLLPYQETCFRSSGWWKPLLLFLRISLFYGNLRLVRLHSVTDSLLLSVARFTQALLVATRHSGPLWAGLRHPCHMPLNLYYLYVVWSCEAQHWALQGLRSQ